MMYLFILIYSFIYPSVHSFIPWWKVSFPQCSFPTKLHLNCYFNQGFGVFPHSWCDWPSSNKSCCYFDLRYLGFRASCAQQEICHCNSPDAQYWSQIIRKERKCRNSGGFIHHCFIQWFTLFIHSFSGRMLACHAGGPGSIPGRCTTLTNTCLC